MALEGAELIRALHSSSDPLAVRVAATVVYFLHDECLKQQMLFLTLNCCQFWSLHIDISATGFSSASVVMLGSGC